jgi:Phage Mu protein F like protein
MDFLTEPVSYDEAVDFIKSKPAVSRAVFDKLLPELKARAFTVAGLEKAEELQAVRDMLAELPQGGNWDDIKHRIAQSLPYSVDPDADPETQAAQREAGDRKAELLLRLHGFQAYSAAAYRALDEQRDVFTYWQYKSMADGRVRHTHAALHNLTLPSSDPFWAGHYPPWEWGCRCQVVGLMDADVQEIRDADKDKPLEKQRIIEGEAHKQLVENGRLVRGPSEIYDVRTPVQRGAKGAFSWNPSDLRISLADLKSRYDAPVWASFEAWSKKAQIPETNLTVWKWLNGIVEKAAGSWPDLSTLAPVRSLGGSTGAMLMKDSDGRQFVVKHGNSAEHVREEIAADRIYQAIGIRVPRATLVETPTGPVKISEFVEGKPLSSVIKTKAGEAALNRIREGFVADALLGNWDVAGLGLDNIIVDADGNPWRIDNGGSLRFRAQGKAKTPAEWGDTVNEINTLRDSNLNPQTARIFAGITDEEIQRQITAILNKREAILAAASPDVSDTLSKRLDNLAQRLAPKGEITQQFADDVKKSRILGRTYLGDFEHIEDHSILFWQELDSKKKPATRAKLRFSDAGFAAIRDKIGPVLQAATPSASSGPQPLISDAFWQPIYGALKTVNHHAGDGAYNADTIAKFTKAESALAAFKPKTPDETAMKSSYTQISAEIRAAMAAKAATKKYDQYLAQPKAAPAPKPGGLRAEVTNMVYSAKERTRGHATEKSATVRTLSGAYRIQVGDVEVTFAPWDSATPYAHRGVATIRVPGEATPERMQKVVDAIKELGIDARPTPPETLELVYLKKTLNFAKPGGDWDQILAATKPDADKVADLKAWVKKKLKLDLSTNPDYQPNGAGNFWGDGWKVWTRWDLPPATIATELAGYGLWHNVSGSLPAFISSLLDGGSQVTNTMERMRVGVPIGVGMSPVQDQNTGGANYFFTRIKSPAALASLRNGLQFKIERLSRADAYSFPSDYFGDVRPAGENTHTKDPQKARGKKIADYQSFSTKSGNETIFKNGLNLLDDIEVIRTNSATERQLVLEVFARHGIDTLPDGRHVKDIIK